MNKLIIILLLGVIVLLVVLFRNSEKMPNGGLPEEVPPANLTEIQQEAEMESFRKTDVAPTM